MIPPSHKKRPRVANNRHQTPPITASSGVIDPSPEPESSQKIRRTSSHPLLHSLSPPPPCPFPSISFGDRSTSDVILDVFSESDEHDAVRIYLHSHALQRSKYFSALLSNRWRPNNERDKTDPLSLKLLICPSNGTLQNYLNVLDLLYVNDFDFHIDTASSALDILPAAVHLLFEDLIRSCVKFLEAVPWSEEEETRVLEIIPFLNGVESEELLARLSPRSESSSEEMLRGLISQAIRHYPNAASSAKAFVAKLLKEVSSRDLARKVLEKAFGESLKKLTESLEEYSSPDCRGSHNETEAKQRVSLHRMLTNGRHLSWLVERMVELRVADKAVKDWSEQPGFTADLQRAFQDDACRNVVPGLPSCLLRCTCKIANAVASGTVLADRQVRVKLVKDWLPVLTVCKDNVSSMLPGPKSLYLELEETFLKIISTLPMSDAQELLQQCLSFSTRNVEDCPHLTIAFNTWFRRATRPPGGDNRIL